MSDWEDITDSGNQWEDITNQSGQGLDQPKADPGILDYLTAVPKKAYASLSDAYAGLGSLYADTRNPASFGSFLFDRTFPTLTSALPRTSQEAKDARDNARRLSEEVDTSLGLDPQGLPQRALDIAGETIPAAASFFAGPLGAAMYIGGSSAAKKYGSLSDLTTPDGVPALSPSQKGLDAALTGGVDAALSYVPLNFLGNSVGTPLTRALKDSLKFGTTNAALSPVGVTSGAVIDRAVAGIPTSPNELMSRIETAAQDSFIQAPLFGAMGALRTGGTPKSPTKALNPIETLMDGLAEQGTTKQLSSSVDPASSIAPVDAQPLIDVNPAQDPSLQAQPATSDSSPLAQNEPLQPATDLPSISSDPIALPPKSPETQLVEQKIVNSSNQPAPEPVVIKLDKQPQEATAFDSPLQRIAQASEAVKAQEPKPIDSVDATPVSVSEMVNNGVKTLAAALKSEKGAVNLEDLFGLGRVSKEVKQATKNDKRYTKYASKHLFAARNWLAADAIAKDVPEVKPLVTALDRYSENKAKVLFDIQDNLFTLRKVQNDPVVRSVIWKAEELGSRFKLDPENLSKLNLSPEQLAGVVASKKLSTYFNNDLTSFDTDLANREYRYTLKRALLEAPIKKQELERQYQLNLQQLRRRAFDPTDPRVYAAEAQLNEKLANDLKGVDTWLNQTRSRAESDRIAAIAAIQQRQAAWDDTNYAPRSRFGRFKLKAYGKDGELIDDRQTDSKAELTQWKKAYETNGLKTSIEVLKTRAPLESFNGMSGELASSLDPVSGFAKHLKPSLRIPGADTDAARAWADYSRGYANYKAQRLIEMDFKEAMLDLPRDSRNPREVDVNLSNAVNELQKRKNSISETKSEFNGVLSKVIDLSNLTFQLRTPFANTAVILQRQWPELTKYKVQPELTISKSLKINLDRMRLSDASFAKKYPELARGIQEARAKGVLSATPSEGNWFTRAQAPIAKQVSRIADNKSKTLSTLDDVAFFLQFHSDRFAEANGFITGWLAYPKATKALSQAGEPVPSQQRFAEQFAKDTKANIKGDLLPAVQQGLLRSTTMKYKWWQVNYLRALFEAAGQGNIGYLGRALGATLAVAGVRGLPFYKTIAATLTALGYNPEDSLQKVIDEKAPPGMTEPIMQNVLYGPLSAQTGINFSGSTGFGDPLPDTSRGVEAAIGSLIGGPIASVARKTVDFPGYVRRGQYDRAIENLPLSVPPITNLAKAYRYMQEGVVTKGGIGIVPKEDITKKLLLSQLLGYGDMKTARAYDKYLAGERAGSQATDAISYPSLIAEAMVRGDMERAQQLQAEAIAAGKILKPGDLIDKIMKRMGDESAIVRKYPKALRGDAMDARQKFNN
jgi:hypothetical protein